MVAAKRKSHAQQDQTSESRHRIHPGEQDPLFHLLKVILSPSTGGTSTESPVSESCEQDLGQLALERKCHSCCGTQGYSQSHQTLFPLATVRGVQTAGTRPGLGVSKRPRPGRHPPLPSPG